MGFIFAFIFCFRSGASQGWRYATPSRRIKACKRKIRLGVYRSVMHSSVHKLTRTNGALYWAGQTTHLLGFICLGKSSATENGAYGTNKNETKYFSSGGHKRRKL
uniref:Putative secreted protein n=1 Tax=Anopheles darlingi TaxID=43151 RepID=A0A2M4D272_ANODA